MYSVVVLLFYQLLRIIYELYFLRYSGGEQSPIPGNVKNFGYVADFSRSSKIFIYKFPNFIVITSAHRIVFFIKTVSCAVNDFQCAVLV